MDKSPCLNFTLLNVLFYSYWITHSLALLQQLNNADALFEIVVDLQERDFNRKFFAGCRDKAVEI